MKRVEGCLLAALNAGKRITHLTHCRAYAVGANTILTRMINTMTDCYDASNDLSDFIREKMQEVNLKMPQLTHDDPHSFACGYNSGYKSCLLSIARRMGFSETQIAEM